MTDYIVGAALLAILAIAALVWELYQQVERNKALERINAAVRADSQHLRQQIREMKSLKYPPLFGLDEMKTPEQQRRWADHKTPKDTIKWPDEAGTK